MITLVTFLIALAVFGAVGLASVTRSKGTTADYLLAGQDVSPLLVAASAFATNFSGYMFIGVVGFVYAYGVSALWLTFGWTLGEALVWIWGHGQVRRFVQAHPAVTVPEVLATPPGDRPARPQHRVMAVTALATLLFLTLYASAQMTAGSKALHVLFGWRMETGAILGAIIVLAYCWAGGLRAAIWSDLAQAVVMFAVMAMLLFAAVSQVGGPVELFARLRAIHPSFVSLRPSQVSFGLLGVVLYVIGWVSGGIGNLGQPQLLIRTMALRRADEIPRVRWYYLSSTLVFRALVVVVALYARVLLSAADVSDVELAMPRLAVQMLHPALAGLFLAGLFAATMSTADSLILACSAALTQDLPSSLRRDGRPLGLLAGKLGTLGITVFALLMALYGPTGVFQIINFAWSSMAAMILPLLVLRLLRKPIREPLAVTMMLVGGAVAVAWRLAGLHTIVLDSAPGILAGFLVFALAGARKSPVSAPE
ncbi:MAG: sodium/proline symporter [Polyangiaceae bacterium]